MSLRFKNILQFTVLICALFQSCDPPREYVEELVRLKATISNTNENIRIGDTLKITLTIPDTLVSATNTKTAVQSLQEAFYNMRIAKVDTIAKNRIDFVAATEYFSQVGSNNNIQIFTSTVKPYKSVLCFVPRSKGVYWLSVEDQPGTIRANNSYKANLQVNFNVVDKHFQMLGAYTTPAILNSLYQADADSIGYYGFKVN